MSTPRKSVIVGTAGHIDHGKSSLVEALTGTHPDRLEEEKRRGITIDLGFAFLEEQGVEFGFVDVPGHERFVGNMLAGAAGIDLVLLVIAADESIKPQTREHFDICRLLGVRHGLVILSKADLVDADTLELARLEVEEYVRGSFLEGAPILAISSKTNAGLADLKAALVQQARQIQGKDAGRDFRLPIDRSFAIKGFGAVVTGTLLSGQVAPNDEVELFPSASRSRVRDVQSGGRSVERAFAGQRTAVNLAGTDHHSLKRGMALATPGRFRATRRVDVRLRVLPSARKLKNRAQVHFHTGSFESIAEVMLFAAQDLAGGQESFAQLKLRESVLALPGDCFIIRQSSPPITIGGGTVLDPLPRRPRAKEAPREPFLSAVERGDKVRVLDLLVRRSLFGLPQKEISSRTGWTENEIREALEDLTSSRQVRLIPAESPLLYPAADFAELSGKMLAFVERFHKENPLQPGILREELRSSISRRLRPEIFRAALEDLAAKKKLEFQGELVKRAGAQVSLLPEEVKAKELIERTFASAGLTVPSVKEVLARLAIESRR